MAIGLTREIGRPGLQVYAGIIQEEFLRQLDGERGRRVLREMSENDATVHSMLHAIEFLIRNVDWGVEPGGESAEDEKWAEFMEGQMHDMDEPWSTMVSEWMAAVIFGYVLFELVLKLRQGDNRDPRRNSKYTDGLYGIRKLGVRHPDTLHRWIYDDAGILRGIEQLAAPDYVPTEIPIEKLLHFRIKSRKGNPEGMSLLRGAYKAYYYKSRIQEIEAIGTERDANGMPVMYVPPSWLDPNASAEDAALLADAKKAMRNLRANQTHGFILPSLFEAGTNTRSIELQLLGTSQGGSAAKAYDTDQSIGRYSREILQSILADVIALGHEKVGSFALADSKTNLFATGIGAMLDSIADTLNRTLVPMLLRVNGVRLEDPPKFVPGDIESIPLDKLADFLGKMSAAGMPLFPQAELEDHLLRMVNLPIPTPEVRAQFEEAAEQTREMQQARVDMMRQGPQQGPPQDNNREDDE